MTLDETLVAMSQACIKHLSLADRLLVASATLAAPERMATLLSSYAGQRFSEAEFAALALRLAKQLKNTRES